MATTIERTTPPAGEPPQPPRGRIAGRERPVGGFELWMWLFMRISGIVLLVLAVGHTLIMHLPADGVERVDYNFVADRWASPLWRTWDWMMLTLALIHGINGLRNVTLDYVRSPAHALRDEHGLLRARLHAVRARHDHRGDVHAGRQRRLSVAASER